jgi:hypothetical protein
MCCGAGIAWAAALFSRDPVKLLAVLSPLRAGTGDEGAGDMRTTSARLLGVGPSLWPWPPRFPWCRLPVFAAAADPRLGKASLSSTASTDGVAARDTGRLPTRDCGRLPAPGVKTGNGLSPGGGRVTPPLVIP